MLEWLSTARMDSNPPKDLGSSFRWLSLSAFRKKLYSCQDTKIAHVYELSIVYKAVAVANGRVQELSPESPMFKSNSEHGRRS